MFLKKKKVSNFKVKPITLFECIEDDKFLPFSLIQKKSDSAYEMMMAERGDNNPNNSLYMKTVEKYITRCVTVNDKPIATEAIETLPEELKISMFNTIINASFKLFKKQYNIPKDTAVNLYFMAKEFGKLPIEIVAVKEIYNELDAYIFNSYCFHCGKQFENNMQRKANQKMKRSRNGR